MNRARQVNLKKRKRKDVPQTQLIEWKTLNQTRIINGGMGNKRQKKNHAVPLYCLHLGTLPLFTLQ